MKQQLTALADRIARLETDIAQIGAAVADAKSGKEIAAAEAKWHGKLLGLFGLGEVGKTGRRWKLLSRQLQQTESLHSDLRRERNAVEARLHEYVSEASATQESVVVSSGLLSEAIQHEKEALAACGNHRLLSDSDFSTAAVTRRMEELQYRTKRIEKYRDLAATFNELVDEATREGQSSESFRQDLLAITNLFCCTTTGVAGSHELRDLVFDTLIVDEASRVTDSEFLIGAIRARRWILVGDEYQLPPYVDQGDEHFIHALSALHKSETMGVSLGEAVDELGQLWEEDEELHRFRRESVHAFAERLLAAGDWTSSYRDGFQLGIDYLRGEVSDPSQALLRSMRDHLVHSLFERVVSANTTGLRVRLVEQRRMIEPIASIVSQPVYRGDYQTPSADDLALHGITPLITATFPTPITFLDTSLLGKNARDELQRNSFINKTEARWIVQACKTLDRELAQADTGRVTVSVLAFYKAQARLIREMLDDQSRKKRFACLRFAVIDAIDRIQGQESDLVFLSFCRTAGKFVPPTFGQWLQDVRRLNVACTRAHRALVFVGQKELLGRLCSNDGAIAFYRHLNKLFEEKSSVMHIVRQFGG